MSGQVGGQVRALPFTGFAALPFLVVGLVISVVEREMRSASISAARNAGEGDSPDVTRPA
jgi:hypothetical protein